MDPPHRDGLLALVALAGLFALGASRAFLRPTTAALGVFGALAVELVFYRYDALAAAWEQRWVQGTGLALVLVGGYVLARTLGPWTYAALDCGASSRIWGCLWCRW